MFILLVETHIDLAKATTSYVLLQNFSYRNLSDRDSLGPTPQLSTIDIEIRDLKTQQEALSAAMASIWQGRTEQTDTLMAAINKLQTTIGGLEGQVGNLQGTVRRLEQELSVIRDVVPSSHPSEQPGVSAMPEQVHEPAMPTESTEVADPIENSTETLQPRKSLFVYSDFN